MKVVLWLRSYGANKVTALIANTSTTAGGAHYGMHLRSVDSAYLRFQSPSLQARLGSICRMTRIGEKRSSSPTTRGYGRATQPIRERFMWQALVGSTI